MDSLDFFLVIRDLVFIVYTIFTSGVGLNGIGVLEIITDFKGTILS